MKESADTVPITKKDDRDWMCVNERSDNYGDYTGFSDRCPDFEGREDDGFITRG